MIGKRYGNYLFILYMVVKFFYIAIALLQLYGLNYVIGNGKNKNTPTLSYHFIAVIKHGTFSACKLPVSNDSTCNKPRKC